MTGLNWGATALERCAAMPCDELLARGTQADRAISVAAPPDLVFAWLCQLRAAPYSYDLLDNFGRRSPRQRNPDLTRLAIGQRFMTIFQLHSFTDGAQITLRGKGAAVTYALRAIDAGTRLHVRVVFGGSRLIGSVLAAGDWVMMRKQLLTMRELAQRDAQLRRLPSKR